LALSSFIERGGQRMHVVVRSPSPGQAIALAQTYRAWLLEHGAWTDEIRALDVLDTTQS
jgi:hypothetical protein